MTCIFLLCKRGHVSNWWSEGVFLTSAFCSLVACITCVGTCSLCDLGKDIQNADAPEAERRHLHPRGRP